MDAFRRGIEPLASTGRLGALLAQFHFSAKSVANAAMIKQQLGEPVEGEYSPAFIDRYPQLAGIVTPAAPSLLHVRLTD